MYAGSVVPIYVARHFIYDSGLLSSYLIAEKEPDEDGIAVSFKPFREKVT